MQESFDDPKLKSAVKRVWGGASASTELRARISVLLRESGADMRIGSGASQPALWGVSFGSRQWMGFGIAAAILLCFGCLTWGPERFPETTASDMVARHDACLGAPDHHMVAGVAPDDFHGLGENLSGQLKIPVISTPLAGWKFAGAGPCPIWGHATAHYLYRNGDKSLSVFSIPTSDMALKITTGEYTATVGTHKLAGFVKDGGLYCVLAESSDGSVSADDARELRNQLQAGFNSVSFNPAPPVAQRNAEPAQVDSGRIASAH